MKKLLPIFVSIAFLLVTLITPIAAHAQQTATASGATDSRWVIDPEVTFIGKNARRAGLFLDWTLKNYNWVCVKSVNDRQCDDSNNPIAKYWSLIVLYIVVPMLFVVILATSIVIIITRGKSLTIMRFIPRFIAVVLLIVFSYSLVQFLYQVTDLIQGFFLRSDIAKACPPDCISQSDLLYVGWDYNTFVGLRLLGDKYAESAFISLLLTKLTALTYFVMIFLLLVRKIILWFFIIVSPVFPILLLFYPVRNTGKIWIGEFFRWLMYAPLFAIFLNGLVYLWQHKIPLNFVNPNIGTAIEFPTAVNILLGGPQQFVTPNNSVNLVETFALYVVSLIMLWIVILLPWILLQIFLDYASNFAPGDTAVMKTLVNMATTRTPPPSSGGTPQPPSEGAAISLPFAKKFSIPKDLQPTGSAKEINAEGSTIKANFAQPAYIPSASINAQVLSLANIKLPSMRDIAKYDASLLSRDRSKQQDIARFTESLTKLANPVVVTNTVERNQVKEVREKIIEHGQKGNLVANSIMNAANASSRSMANVSNQKVKSALQQISNPAAAPANVRDKMSKMHDMLVKESKNTSNTAQSQLANSVLSVNEKTTEKEVQKIKDQLQQSSNTELSKSISSAVSQSVQSSSQIQGVIKQVSNPDSVAKKSDREQVVKLKTSLEKASKEGNQLATSILSVTDKTPVTEIEALQKRIQQAKEKGEPLATEVSSVAQTTNQTTLPMVNRVQTVSKEDYQAVKDMWMQNYKNLDVPEGMAGSRSDWIKDDISGIDETIGLLSSQDETKVQEGMDRVSNLLPFLLVGGFSQTEIIDYLKAKQDAAKEVSKSLASEEEEKVSVKTKTTHAAQTMAATMEETPSSSESASPSPVTNAAEEESPLSSLASASANAGASTSAAQSSSATEIMNMVNVSLPKLRDIAQFETRALKNDTSRREEMQKIQKVLSNIADPTAISDVADRSKYEKIHQTLLAEQQKGNPTADFLLKASLRAQGKSPESAKAVLSKIANPSLATAEADKERFTKLHDSLEKASQEGNTLATSILATKETTPAEDVEALSEKLKAEKEEAVAASVLPELGEEAGMPEQNSVQPVSNEEYEEIQKLWEENYRTLPVPSEYGSDRASWIKADTAYVEETVSLLHAPEAEKQQEGQKRVSDIMPMLLLGGFSSQEIIGYLQAKLTAGKNVLTELQKEEETKVTVKADQTETEKQKTVAEEESNK